MLLGRWAAQRWHEPDLGIYTERGNPRADDKGVHQVRETQGESTNAVMGADRIVVVMKVL
jgi:hypothetical protein